MSSTSTLEIREQTLRYELYLDVKRGCKITVCVLVIIGLIGAIYVGTTPWGQAMIQKIKDFLVKPLRVQDILLYMVLVPAGICAIGFTIPSIIRRIDICCAQPILKESENPINLDLSEDPSAEEIHIEESDNETESSSTVYSDTDLE